MMTPFGEEDLLTMIRPESVLKWNRYKVLDVLYLWLDNHIREELRHKDGHVDVKRKTTFVVGGLALVCLAGSVLVFPPQGLSAPVDDGAEKGWHGNRGAEVYEIDFHDSLPLEIPPDPRRALSFPFFVEGPELLAGLHLHMIADVESPGGVSAIVVGPDGSTWALAPDALIDHRPGKLDVWLDLLEEGAEVLRNDSHGLVKGTWTVQVFQSHIGNNGTLFGLEVVLETSFDDPSEGEAATSVSASEGGIGTELESKKYPIEAAPAAIDGCGGGETSGGCSTFVGGTSWIPQVVLLAIVLGLVMFLSLREERRRSAWIDKGGEQ